MNYLITENLPPSGAGQIRLTRSCVVDIADSKEVPEGAVPTDEAPRDWSHEPAKENA